MLLPNNLTGLTEDSRKVQPGFLYAAFKGVKSDGYDFIPAAIAAGAIAVLSDRDFVAPANVTKLIDTNPRQLFGEIAARFYAPLPATILAVTGTNGKTSTVHFARQLLTRLGHKAASLGTIGVMEGDVLAQEGAMTTPDTVTLYKTLAGLAKKNIRHVAMEASSHGLHQHRLSGIRLKAAAFTNLTRDHLDYHGTMEAYFAAKAEIFAYVEADGTAVINSDIVQAPALREIIADRELRVIDFGKTADVLKVENLTATPQGLSLKLKGYPLLQLPLIGLYQAENILASIGLVMGCGFTLEQILPQLAHLTSVPGRMEKVGEKTGAAVIVDYAHTPDALEKLLEAARCHTSGKLMLVFGCGGDRDAGKRPLMGAIAEKMADQVIITDDNPRTEDASAIRRAIREACPNAREIGDRKTAIETAIASAKPGDIIVIAGKGHENYQIIGTTKHPFSDQEIAKACL